MRFALAISLFCVSFVTVAEAAAQESAIPWMSDVKAARAAAEQSGKLVLVHFWMPNCPPCAALERDVFSQPQVTQIMQERFVLVKVNAIDSRQTAEELGVTNVPADVVLTPQGEVLDRSISPNSPMAYLAHVSKIASKHRTGQGSAFDAAVANAPVQVQNPAYGNLNVPTASANQNATVPSPSVAQNPANAAPSAVSNPYVAAPPVTPEPNSTAGGPASMPQGSPSGEPVIGDRYAMNSSVAAAPTNNLYSRMGTQEPTVPSIGQTSKPAASMPASGERTGIAATPGKPSEATGTQQQAPQQTAVATLPPGSPPLGFDGYCPVSIMRQVGQLPESQWKMVPGDKRFGLEHRGKVYLFASEECRKQFYENPDYYSPALAGLDPVLFLERSQSAPGTIKHGVEYNGKIYLFSSEQTLNRFRQHAEQYATGVRQAMQSAPGRMIR